MNVELHRTHAAEVDLQAARPMLTTLLVRNYAVRPGISVATLGQQWRTTMHYNMLNARVTPDNPVYLATILRLQGALTTSVGPVQVAQTAVVRVVQSLAQQLAMLANIDHFMFLAVLGVPASSSPCCRRFSAEPPSRSCSSARRTRCCSR